MRLKHIIVSTVGIGRALPFKAANFEAQYLTNLVSLNVTSSAYYNGNGLANCRFCY